MNLHEQIDRFLNQTPRFKVSVFLAVVGSVAAIFAFVFWLGVRSGDGWAERRYIKERDARLKAIEQYEHNAVQLEAENALLKKQNELAADALKQADSARTHGDEKQLAALLEERTKRYEDIDLDANFDSQLCGLCSDVARSGFRLSDSVCGRCKAAEKTGR